MINKTRYFNNEKHFHWVEPDLAHKLCRCNLQLAISATLNERPYRQQPRRSSRPFRRIACLWYLLRWAITCKISQTNRNLLINDSSGMPNQSVARCQVTGCNIVCFNRLRIASKREEKNKSEMLSHIHAECVCL